MTKHYEIRYICSLADCQHSECRFKKITRSEPDINEIFPCGIYLPPIISQYVNLDNETEVFKPEQGELKAI